MDCQSKRKVLNKDICKLLVKLKISPHDKKINCKTLPIVETPATNRSQMTEYRRKQRANAELERAARKNELEVDLDEVKKEHLESGALFNDIRMAADLYGIYEDLFGTDILFTPSKDIRLEFDYDDEYITPVFRGETVWNYSTIYAQLKSLNL